MAVEPLRILLVDDDPDDLQIITRLLGREFAGLQVQTASTPRAFEKALDEGNFKLVISDFQLHWTTGLALLRTIKQRYPYRPVIMFTATGTQEVAVQAMKSGLDDYIIKSPKHYPRLTAAVRRSLRYTEAERRAAELQVRLDRLLIRLNIGVYRADNNGKLLDCNPTFLELLGAGDLREADAIYQSHLSKASGEIRLTSPEGDRWFSVDRVVLPETGGGPAVEGLLQEVTDRKCGEQQERALRAEAERLLRVKDEFLSTVSHELRTPLNLISGWAYLLYEGGVEGPVAKNALESIIRNVRAQARIIDDLTDVSGIITGKLRLDMKDVDVAEWLKNAVEGLRQTAQSKDVQLDEYRPAEALMVKADPIRLQQIVWNLLSNAIKFTEPGGCIHADAARERGQIVISVRDTGCGISPDFLPHVFDRFSQADSSKTRKKGGLGLGLALVRHLAELHGGAVEAASEGPGRGATFTVRLPAVGESSRRLVS